jgi:glucokinase
MLLAGDVGGTNARLALFDTRLQPQRAATFKTASYESFDEIVGAFVRPADRIAAAAFGVAGVVTPDAVSGVNLPWRIDRRALALSFRFPITLVNDLEANARGIAALAPHDLAVVNRGAAGARGTRAVVSAGTGLGEAALWWDGHRHRVVPSEGGHADFAPRSALEVDLYRYLAAHHGHVSYERVCSGPGLVEIYRFLRRIPHSEPAPDPALITAEASVDRNSIGARALELFASIYGARAGNVALQFMATGGVYLGGGIAPKLLGWLQRGPFVRAFIDKGRLTPLLRDIPVHVVLNDKTALLGAARIANDTLNDVSLAIAA